jgi:hypothetical protein
MITRSQRQPVVIPLSPDESAPFKTSQAFEDGAFTDASSQRSPMGVPRNKEEQGRLGHTSG